MIVLTKLNGASFAVNCDLIETIEQNPDTMVRMTTKNYFNVKESMQEVIDKIVEFRRTCTPAFSTETRRE
ncbi:flagellar FlbD family protein [Acidaminobacterium chupaoyuni]|mgnify:CR=1 FL=1